MVTVDGVPLLLKLTKKNFPYKFGSIRVKTINGVEIGWIVPDGAFRYQSYARGWKPLLAEASTREEALRALLVRRRTLETTRLRNQPDRFRKSVFGQYAVTA